MKIAFVGKGGSGKTTISALLCRFLTAKNKNVIAIDSDINQHLASSLGIDESQLANIPLLGRETDKFLAHIKGTNRLIKHHSDIIRTTPPGPGSHLIDPINDSLLDYFSYRQENLRLIRVGQPASDQFGRQCYHVNMSAASILLNHLLDRPDHYTVVDLTAGIDAVVSGMLVSYDAIVVVVEPTLKSVEVYRDFAYHCEHNKYCAPIMLVANKIEAAADLEFITTQTGHRPIAAIGSSAYIKALERGPAKPLTDIESALLAELGNISSALGAITPDRQRLYRGLAALHRHKAAGRPDGDSLLTQIDPNFDPLSA